ncbi:hypothetical protein D187_001628 [Cystobacter fuscus DSM 2262]|uniref:Outer membrane protein beta-barrel domain-containing protein n=1 Tax=Cystobacter fuscus (strain ATCC 25194 / DSM 2262 / NBRC 100088 / M29) TaxID=1242864 RepID=S9PD10_CYSF2|nr:hypothetical protein D187_001628 [Cystobacter fuscus DSM 2262]
MLPFPSSHKAFPLPRGLLPLLLLGLPLGSAWAQEPEDEDPPPETELTRPAPTPVSPDTEPEWKTRFGARLLAGAPDGTGAALLIHPRSWLRVHAGAARNSLGTGVRAGVDLLPARLLVSPVLGLEYGHTFRADYERLLTRLHGQPTTPVTGIRQVDYDQVNLSVGLEFSPWRHVTFFGGAGISYWFLGVSDATAFIREAEAQEGQEEPSLTANPLLLNLSTPVVRLGLILYFN